jgi:hypothetical protein
MNDLVFDLARVLRGLLATLPKCHACDRPATRWMMSTHVRVPAAYHVERGKTFHWRSYTGPSGGAHMYVPEDGTWHYDCCDVHEMPAEMKPMGTWDHATAEIVRQALKLLGSTSPGGIA